MSETDGLIGKSVYSMWNAKLKGRDEFTVFPTVFESQKPDGQGHEDPQPGLWKVWGGYVDPTNKRSGNVYVPMQVWLADDSGAVVNNWRAGLEIKGTIADAEVTASKIIDRWLGATAISKATRDHYREHGQWPEDPPAVSAAAKAEAAKKAKEEYAAETAPPALKLDLEPVPGAVEPGGTGSSYARHQIGGNSGPAGVEPLKPERNQTALAVFRNTKIEIEADIAEAVAYYARNPIKTKSDADRAENWRKRIDKAGKDADAKRREELRPFEAVIDEINGSYKAISAAAITQAKAMGANIDVWAKAEQKRLDDEARKAAEEKLAKEREATRLANEARQKKFDEEKAARDALMKSDVALALLTPEPEAPKPAPLPSVAATPVVASAPKVMVGSQGARRSVRTVAATAIITDLAKAAAHLAGMADPDLIALIQKRADKAAKAGVSFPGCVLASPQTAE